MISSTTNARRTLPLALAAAAAVALIAGGAFWFANTDNQIEMAQLDEGAVVTTAPVTEDTPGPVIHDMDTLRSTDQSTSMPERGHERFPEAGNAPH